MRRPVRVPFIPHVILLAFSAAVLAAPARGENAPRVIETRPLKLIGDGAASPASPAARTFTVVTPALRLIGDGRGARTEAPAPNVVIETRPLRLLGSKP